MLQNLWVNSYLCWIRVSIPINPALFWCFEKFLSNTKDLVLHREKVQDVISRSGENYSKLPKLNNWIPKFHQCIHVYRCYCFKSRMTIVIEQWGHLYFRKRVRLPCWSILERVNCLYTVNNYSVIFWFISVNVASVLLQNESYVSNLYISSDVMPQNFQHWKVQNWR